MPTLRRRGFVLAVLCLGGGIIYILPYLQYSYYDSLRAFLRISHAQMGVLMSIYGLLNLAAYLFGGLLADRVPYRILVSGSLLITGASGLWFAAAPPYPALIAIHVIWSLATVFTYWPAMIKAVKLLGTSDEQGRLFGFREAGFGLFGLLYALVGLAIFRATGETLRPLLLYYSGLYLVAGVLSYVLLPGSAPATPSRAPSLFRGLTHVLRQPPIWLAGIVIFCGYAISAGMGRINPYLTQVLKLSAGAGALIAVLRTYALPYLGCVAGGIVVDRIRSATAYMMVAFLAVALLLTAFVLTPGRPDALAVVIVLALSASLVIYTIRGVYFVPLDEAGVPDAHLGTAAGVLSVIGYLPDTFLFAVHGSILDTYRDDPETAFKILFGLLLGLAVLGFLATVVLRRLLRGVDPA